MSAKEVEILLVEDNPDDLQLMLHALRKENFLCNAIQIVRDGEEALDFMFCRGPFAERDPADHPNLVLLDLKLPKVDGLQVLREIKNDPRTRAVPVVILTTSDEEKDMIAGYQLGANSYLQKPVEFTAFLKMVKEIGFYWMMVNHPPPAVAMAPRHQHRERSICHARRADPAAATARPVH